MTVYEAWIKAQPRQKIYRASVGAPLESVVLRKDENNLFAITDKILRDLSADDWEVVRKKHKIEVYDTEFAGQLGLKSITDLVYEKTGGPRPEKFSKVTFEWEE